jgi:murein L,D-transpeptidase YafK
MPLNVFAFEKADKVLVVKSEARLYLLKSGKVIAVMGVAFGGNPVGHKLQQGDERTPEGSYILDYKNPNSAFYKSIHISYPNTADKKHARKAGVDPGGDIMLHGQKNGFGWLSWMNQNFNWTNGCIAVSNSDMDMIWAAVSPGTPIEIRP